MRASSTPNDDSKVSTVGTSSSSISSRLGRLASSSLNNRRTYFISEKLRGNEWVVSISPNEPAFFTACRGYSSSTPLSNVPRILILYPFGSSQANWKWLGIPFSSENTNSALSSAANLYSVNKFASCEWILEDSMRDW